MDTIYSFTSVKGPMLKAGLDTEDIEKYMDSVVNTYVEVERRETHTHTLTHYIYTHRER